MLNDSARVDSSLDNTRFLTLCTCKNGFEIRFGILAPVLNTSDGWAVVITDQDTRTFFLILFAMDSFR